MSGPCCAADTRRPVDGTPLDRAFSYVRAAGEAASAGRPQRPLAQEIEMTYRDDTVRKTEGVWRVYRKEELSTIDPLTRAPQVDAVVTPGKKARYAVMSRFLPTVIIGSS